ncbi:MAG: hypothetical protein GY749_28225 [Desulfobacteraceae bacterium]|nr:hypothetical protein [Desulfobacteraceae bacterium]
MEEEITYKKVIELVKRFPKITLSGLSEDEILSILEGGLTGFSAEERKLLVKTMLPGLSIEKRLEGLKPEERMAGLKPEERLAGLSVEEIEAYLKKLEKSSPKN